MNTRHSWRQTLRWGIGLAAIATVGTLLLLKQNPQGLTLPSVPKSHTDDETPHPTDMITYDTIEHPRSIIHVVRISATAKGKITPIIASNGLKTLEEFVHEINSTPKDSPKVIAAINAGFFDPNNAQTTSLVVKNGQLILNPTQNSRLIDNPNLSSYMPKILNRSEFRRYQCQTGAGKIIRYAIAPHQQPTPSECQLLDSIGAGPALLPNFTGEAEAFLDPTVGRDAIGSNSPNARSAVGITYDGSILFIMAAQRKDRLPSSGLTLMELADIMANLDVQEGLNLDGGSSSSVYYKGNIYYGKLEANQVPIKRPIKSALAIFLSHDDAP